MNYEDYILRTKKSLENIDSKISLAFSHQIEDVITIDLAIRSKVKELEIFTLDTKKLFKESLEYQSMVEDFFKIKIKTYQADENSLKSIDLEIGEYGMRENLQKRKLCCEVRKITPLKKALSESKAWISGIRAEQSSTRVTIKLVEDDETFNLIKINPIFDLSTQKMWEFAKENNFPINELYHGGFLSIGCATCTRAVKDGEDIRAGRWWWENPEHKECGLHFK